MSPEQYEHLTELFHAALEIAPHQREAFLDQVSDGDPALRHELESLLAAHEQRLAHTEKPIDDIAAAFCQAQQDDGASGTAFPPNTQLDYYKIRCLLGKGGMSEVYLAEDMRLHRNVALKMLPAEVASNQNRMWRFKQEAQAAAALNHPNIAHIYEIGECEDTHFIALEYIDGDTLRDKIHCDKAPAEELLQYLIQVAEGLNKAHLAGIVHRDLKPENIMITRDSYAKILDFGLAKLIERRSSTDSDSFTWGEVASAVTAQHSLAGMVMGTAGYMSPEQAQGHVQEIDHRSDIFSFGCILFEALTRHRPFVDTSVIESLHKVVYESPPPIKNFNPSVPPDLERIVRLCLAKDPEQRYQTIKDVTIALKKIRCGRGAAELERAVPATESTRILRSQVTEQSVGLTSNLEYIVGEIKRHKRSAAIALSVLIIATAAFAYFSNLKPNRAPVLTDQDTIVVADFDNKTGDKDFDDTLQRALVMQLEQSPFFTIFSAQRVTKTLGYMMRPPTERLTPEIAREICQREGLKAMLTGSIAPLGTHYYLTLEAIDPRTGDALVRTQTEVESKERVLRTLGEAATELRQKLGESLSSVQKFDAPLEQATTSSLEALKDFSLAMRQIGPDALATKSALYNRAIELDPDFALAYARLSMIYFASQQGELAMEAARNAFELRDRVSEWERFDASIRYYQLVTVEWDKVVETAQLWISTYPKAPQPYNILATHFRWSGQYERAIEAANQAISRPPAFVAEYESLGRALMGLNRFREAKNAYERALAQKLESYNIHRGLYVLAFINGDAVAMQRELNTQSTDVASGWKAEAAAFAGQSQRARELTPRAGDLRTAKVVVAQYASEEFLWSAIFAQCRQNETKAWQTFALTHIRAAFDIGLALALCGETKLLQALIAETKQREPKHTFINRLYLPLIQAASEIETNKPALALSTLETIGQYEEAAGFWPRYLRGQAYLRLTRATEAVIEFQKILDHRGEDPLSPLYPLAHLGLARAAALTGDSAKSRKAYEDFFTLWKDADAKLPVMIEAKKEYHRQRMIGISEKELPQKGTKVTK